MSIFRPETPELCPQAGGAGRQAGQGALATGAGKDKGEARVRFRFGTEEIEVNIPDRATLERKLRARLAAGEGFALATINLDHLDKLKRDAGFRRAYAAQDFVVADGNPIVWLSRLARRPVALLPGSDLVVPLARLAAEAGVKLALVGATRPVLEAAGARLAERVEGLEICAEIAPPMGFDPEGAEAGEILAALERAGAGLVLVALGAPKQEVFAARGRREVPRLGFASIGAGLDFIAGSQRRAPRWVRALALEWLWRALGNPRRLAGRYLRSALALPGHVWRAWRLRAGNRA